MNSITWWSIARKSNEFGFNKLAWTSNLYWLYDLIHVGSPAVCYTSVVLFMSHISCLYVSELYHDFIKANRQPTAQNRLNSLRKLVHMLPGPHYETLKFLITHLRLVADHCEVNKVRNEISIVHRMFRGEVCCFKRLVGFFNLSLISQQISLKLFISRKLLFHMIIYSRWDVFQSK